jgi:hypothetical protein
MFNTLIAWAHSTRFSQARSVPGPMVQENLAQSLKNHGFWRVAWPLVSPFPGFERQSLTGATPIFSPLSLVKTVA